MKFRLVSPFFIIGLVSIFLLSSSCSWWYRTFHVKPAAPKNLQATYNFDTKEATISWDQVKGADSYVVNVLDSTKTNLVNSVEIPSHNNDEEIEFPLNPNIYFIRVGAVVKLPKMDLKGPFTERRLMAMDTVWIEDIVVMRPAPPNSPVFPDCDCEEFSNNPNNSSSLGAEGDLYFENSMQDGERKVLLFKIQTPDPTKKLIFKLAYNDSGCNQWKFKPCSGNTGTITTEDAESLGETIIPSVRLRITHDNREFLLKSAKSEDQYRISFSLDEGDPSLVDIKYIECAAGSGVDCQE